MEYIGSRVKKELQGNITLFGFVQAYLANTGFFNIMYDNGDSEELSLPEMSSLLVSLPEELSVQRPGGMPEKRRCTNPRGPLGGLDLNEGENWVLSEGVDLNRRIGEGSSGVGRGLIDLNVDISEGFKNVCGGREMRNFDLNVKLIDDEVGDFCDGEGKLGGDLRVCGEGDKRKGKELAMHVDDQLSSPAAGAFSVGCENSEEHIVLPSKVELPSSGSLNLQGVSVLDLISVYVFLRSFSTLLFLSPFELDDFLACIICTDSTLLFDSIHVSLLQTLRIHLESLSNEGSKSAYACLRWLNWDLLDLITWPIFLVEYLLLKSPGPIDFCHLEPLQSDFYKLPVSAKIQILQHLCDDVVETENFRSELSRRSSVMEQNKDLDKHMKFESSKRRKAIMDGASTSCVREDDSNEPSDWNGEECYLCKMDGNLICCDGCPGAFHSRCVGVFCSQLPKGEWYCPECSINRNNPWSKMWKSIRGAELLGIDPHGRLYYSSFDYLLVLESCDDKCSSWCYKKKDLPTLIEALKSLPFLYDTIIGAICHWNVKTRVDGSREQTSREAWTISKVEQANNISSANYVNLYEYARKSSLATEESACKSSDTTSEDILRSKKEIILGQAKVVLNRFAAFSWSNIQNSNVNSRKEKCGWCFYCKYPENDRDCLFVMNDVFPVVENFTSEALGIGSRKNRKKHLIDVMCHIICIENHLQGLLVGPWLNPHYSQCWRKSVLGVADLASLKSLILEVESNLHYLGLSADWRKHVDSVPVMGSACHIVSSSIRLSSKQGTHRKRAKSPKVEIAPSSNDATGVRKHVDTSSCDIVSSSSGVSSKQGTHRKRCKPLKLEITPSSNAAPSPSSFWWRGGRTSRKLFNFKVLPHSLAFKAGRQGGCKKILGVHYPDSGKYAKRVKYTAWRAAVETSRSVEQLALQVREVDANIKWDDIGNNNLLSKTDIQSKKPFNSFKKAIICKKSSDGMVANYLLDFGRRRPIPDVVRKHGSRLQDSSSDRKKYWLEESRVPLYLLKAYEEKRITLKSNKNCSEELPESCKEMRKVIKKKGFEYLFSRAERLENYQCGHCKKDVLISEAVSCEYCGGFFHKRHVRKSAESITAGYTYTCHKCEESVIVKAKKGGSKLRKGKKTMKELKPSCSGKGKNPGKDKQPKGSEEKGQKNRKLAKLKDQLKKWALQKKTKSRGRSYWLNGLQLTRSPIDERVMNFRSKKLLVRSGEETSFSGKPECSLCNNLEYSAELSYLACEICGVWFHGDALGLADDKIENLIGFKCYKCLNKKPPFCPHSSPTVNNMPNQDDMTADRISQSNNESENILMGSRKQRSIDIVETNYFVATTWCILNERNCWASVTKITIVEVPQ